jgi:hypothetical protein
MEKQKAVLAESHAQKSNFPVSMAFSQFARFASGPGPALRSDPGIESPDSPFWLKAIFTTRLSFVLGLQPRNVRRFSPTCGVATGYGDQRPSAIRLAFEMRNFNKRQRVYLLR